MKSLRFLLPLLVFTSAQTPTTSPCQCPQVKCPASNAADLCKCLNNRETLCKKACPTYLPTYLPCPANPPSPSSTPCTCEMGFCVQSWPESCYCGNAQKQRCFTKCGGVQPNFQQCPPQESPSLITIAKPNAKPASFTPPSYPQPSGTHAPCGGGRSGYRECGKGETCIKDPYKPGDGPAADQLGICVRDKMCGGFAGFECEVEGQVCEDDPRDDCEPLGGGADCAGLCVWPVSLRGKGEGDVVED